MAFKNSNDIKPFEKKIWLSSPTMHGKELEYMQEAYTTNWMSTVGKNLNEIETQIAEFIGVKYAVALSAGTTRSILPQSWPEKSSMGRPDRTRGRFAASGCLPAT